MTNKKELKNEELEKVSGGFMSIKSKPMITPIDILNSDVEVGTRVKIYKVIELNYDNQKIEFITKGKLTNIDDELDIFALGDDGITYESKVNYDSPNYYYLVDYFFEKIN